MYKDYQCPDVDTYIANAPADGQARLREVRTAVQAAMPGAEEVVAWGMPCYKQDGYVVGYVLMTGYISFGQIDQIDPEVRKHLEAAGYKTGSKTFRINHNQPIPADAIKQIMETTAAKNRAKQAAKTGK